MRWGLPDRMARPSKPTHSRFPALDCRSKCFQPCVVGPNQRIGLSVGAGGVRELVRPDQRSRGDVGREALAQSGAGRVAGGRGDGLERQIRGNEKRRQILGRAAGGSASIQGVIDGGPGCGCGESRQHGAILRGGCSNGRRGSRRSCITAGAAGACVAAGDAGASAPGQKHRRKNHRSPDCHANSHCKSPFLEEATKIGTAATIRALWNRGVKRRGRGKGAIRLALRYDAR